MKTIRLLLVIATIAIYAITVMVATSHGFNWPAVAIHDLQALDWRTQFDIDFIIYLLLFALWVVWREGFTARSYLYGVLSIAMGGMFAFPYLLYASYAAKGDPVGILLGRNRGLE